MRGDHHVTVRTAITGARRARKLTVNQLAVYSGISSATISKIENGKRGTPKPATIKNWRLY